LLVFHQKPTNPTLTKRISGMLTSAKNIINNLGCNTDEAIGMIEKGGINETLVF